MPADRIQAQFGLEKDSYILFLGRLVPEKGVHYLIDAYRQICTDKKLVIAGDTSDTDDYVRQLKTMAEGCGNVMFTGFVQGQVLHELYSNAYLYVLPSDVEGMPLSLLEAMSYGNCCLTSDIEECTEVTGEQGATFRRGDVADLLDKLQILRSHADLVNKYKEKAADYICQRYNWDTVVKETLLLYRGETEHESVAGEQISL